MVRLLRLVEAGPLPRALRRPDLVDDVERRLEVRPPVSGDVHLRPAQPLTGVVEVAVGGVIALVPDIVRSVVIFVDTVTPVIHS